MKRSEIVNAMLQLVAKMPEPFDWHAVWDAVTRNRWLYETLTPHRVMNMLSSWRARGRLTANRIGRKGQPSFYRRTAQFAARNALRARRRHFYQPPAILSPAERRWRMFREGLAIRGQDEV